MKSISLQFLYVLISLTAQYSSSIVEDSEVDISVKHKKYQSSYRLPNKRIDPETGAARALYNLEFSIDGVDDPILIANAFLEQNTNLLKMSSTNDLIKLGIKKTKAGTSVRYYQRWNNFEVYDSGVTVAVNNKNVVSFVSSNYKPNIKLSNSFSRIDEINVVRTALKEIDVRLSQVSASESKRIVFVEGKTSRVAWLVKIIAMKNKLVSYEFIYDAISGENLQIKNLIYDKAGGGDITTGIYNVIESDRTQYESMPSLENHYTKRHRYIRQRKNIMEEDDLSLIESFLPYVSFLLSGEKETVDAFGGIFDPNPLATAGAKYFDLGFRDNADFASPQLDDQVQNVTLRDVSFDGVYYKLEGPYAVLNDFDKPYSCLVQPVSTTSDFYRSRSDNVFDAVNAYYHIDTMLRYIILDLEINVGPTEYTGGFQFDPHASDGEDNSFYSSWSQQLGYGEGGVDDAEDADVVVHELAHALHDILALGMSQEDGLAEGVGDYLAMSYSRSKELWTPADPEYYWVYSWDGHNEFWDGRITNYEKKYPNGLVGDVHIDGQIWSTCNMKIWDAIGREASDKIHLIGLSYTGRHSNQDDLANAIIAAARDLNYPVLYIAQIIGIYSGCGYNVSCGNGIREGSEQCDGLDVGDATCHYRGCSLGIPKCTPSCELDYSECFSGEEEFLLEIRLTFDNFPHENSWDVVDSNNAILFSESNYNNAGETVGERMCLNEGCYFVNIYDQADDGMCCNFGWGGYELTYNNTFEPGLNFTSGSLVTHSIGNCS